MIKILTAFAAVAILTLAPTFGVDAAQSPTPGWVVVDNMIQQGASGCEGQASTHYALMPSDREGRIKLLVAEDCSVTAVLERGLQPSTVTSIGTLQVENAVIGEPVFGSHVTQWHQQSVFTLGGGCGPGYVASTAEMIPLAWGGQEQEDVTGTTEMRGPNLWQRPNTYCETAVSTEWHYTYTPAQIYHETTVNLTTTAQGSVINCYPSYMIDITVVLCAWAPVGGRDYDVVTTLGTIPSGEARPYNIAGL